LSRKTGRIYRLPSEAEWEYACRARTLTPFHFGEAITTDLSNYRGIDWKRKGRIYSGNYGGELKGVFREQTTEVGSFSSNAFGLCEMHGNVWEWCEDFTHSNYESAPTTGGVWSTGGDQRSRILHGGSWFYTPQACRSANRYGNSAEFSDHDIGFRVVLVLA
jgi:formylglycine-generating enzyme required for sulfatase activity